MWLLTIIVSVPIFASSSYLLYKRLVLEETVPRPVPRPQHRPEEKEDDDFAKYLKDLESTQNQHPPKSV
ncbi:hypothetical protein BGW38_004142 [Lunasporangiospora selenospora]|uniref:Uncharacterized protein n=1 Tax=Lunasporangiospora selenospora TaxID=979761 RepID=A0A9P6KHL4_9FUNG|nr:hypothetical protein BGW38_004142 [Lunasporangiospora selenospora]